MNSALLLTKRTFYHNSKLREFSFSNPFRDLKENTQLLKLLLKLMLTIVLISTFIYFSYRWFGFEFRLAKTKYASVFLEKSSTKSGIAAGFLNLNTIFGGVSQGISAVTEGISAVNQAVTSATNIIHNTSEGITKTVMGVVSQTTDTVSQSVSNVMTGYSTISRDTVVTWSWIGGSGLLGLLLALLFIL